MRFAQFKGGRAAADVWVNPEAVTSVVPAVDGEGALLGFAVINLQDGKSQAVQGDVDGVVKQLIEADA